MSDFNYKVISTPMFSGSLTSSYVAGAILNDDNQENPHTNDDQLILLVAFTKGALTTANFKVEFSTDKTTWYQESFEGSPTAGVSVCTTYTRQLNATGNYRFAIPIKDRYIRVSALGNITDATSNLIITAIVGSVA